MHAQTATHHSSSHHILTVRLKATLAHDRASAAHTPARAPEVTGGGITRDTLGRHYEGGRDGSAHAYKHHSAALTCACTDDKLMIN